VYNDLARSSSSSSSSSSVSSVTGEKFCEAVTIRAAAPPDDEVVTDDSDGISPLPTTTRSSSSSKMSSDIGGANKSSQNALDRRVAIAVLSASGGASLSLLSSYNNGVDPFIAMRSGIQELFNVEDSSSPSKRRNVSSSSFKKAVNTQKVWSDEHFAATMRDGMRDYELIVQPVKQELFRTADLTGKDVVEVGLGSGPSIPFYSSLGVNSLVGVEPNLAMHDMARQAARDCEFWDGVSSRLKIVPGFAENIPLADCSADVVVCTMLLCSVLDVAASVAEIKRVLRPGGRFVFLEHVAAPRGSILRAMQTIFDPLQQTCACGCHLARDPLSKIRAAGWDKLQAQYFSLGQTLEEAGAVAPSLSTEDGSSSTRGWRPANGVPAPHFLLSPHLAGIAYKPQA
jgi:ubiquinone/menaquinone biosynthesis C-methylase UbiE